MNNKENFVSRLGFLMVVAGCAIGLGNVWRFPFITGESGGAIFVLFYLFFLITLGLPVMLVELSIGRAAQASPVKAYPKLTPHNKKWIGLGLLSLFGLYLLMSYYSVITGWILYYLGHLVQGDFSKLNNEEVDAKFINLLNSPSDQFWCTLATIFISCLICYRGLQKGVEKFTKPAMIGLLLILIVLVIKSLSLEKAHIGLAFYLMPNLDNLEKVGLPLAIYNAMNQAFFTLSLGTGAVLAIGACAKKDHSLLKESLIICSLDTIVALAAGLIIFPACFNFGITPNQGPTLIFQTLLHMFNMMDHGIVWGSLFFFFLFIAALLTMLAVIEAIIATCSEIFNCSRAKSSLVNFFILVAISTPIMLGYNVLSSVQPLGEGSTILDFADFLMSNNLLPIGSVLMIIYCTSRFSWGWDNFVNEINQGIGIKLTYKKWLYYYFKFVIPCMIITILAMGYYQIFFK